MVMGRQGPGVLSKRRSTTQLCVKVLLLDDQYLTLFVDSKSTGEELFSAVCNELDLLERDFFGLRYLDSSHNMFWLDPAELVKRQLKVTAEFECYFCVKYYIADPGSLREELTRYYFFLQIKRDIYQGRILVAPSVAAGLFGCILQSELGDYDCVELDSAYARDFEFMAGIQCPDLEEESMHVHESLTGLVPSDAERRFLEKAKWLPLYGVDLHPVKGAAGVPLQIGISQVGIAVFQNSTRVSFFHWPKINKVQFRRKFFVTHVIIALDDGRTSLLRYKFLAGSERCAKELWRCAVEQHCFFRRIVVNPDDDFTRGGGLLRSGTKFRYTGKTEFQVRQSLRIANRDPPTFTRASSRFSRRSLPTASRILPADEDKWRTQRGLTINDNPHNKALKMTRKGSNGDRQESLYARLSKPLKRVVAGSYGGGTRHRKADSKGDAEQDHQHQQQHHEDNGASPRHAKAQRTTSAPGFVLRKGKRGSSGEHDAGSIVSREALYTTPSKQQRKGLSPVDTNSDSMERGMHNRSTESTQRFTMPWCDEPDPIPPPRSNHHSPEKPGMKVSEIYSSQRNRLIRQQSTPVKSTSKSFTRSASPPDSDDQDDTLSRSHPVVPPPLSSQTGSCHSSRYSSPQKLVQSPTTGLLRLDVSPIQRPRSALDSRGSESPGGGVGGAGSGGVVGRRRFLSSGGAATEWPWRHSGTPNGAEQLGTDSGQEADYLREEHVSDEAHKRFMQKLWDDMACADAPPPIDLAIKPKVIARHKSATAIKARKYGAMSAVLSGTAAEKVMQESLSTGNSSDRVDATPLDCGSPLFGHQQGQPMSYYQSGFSDTLPAIPKRNSNAGDKRKAISARDRRASVLGVQLFTGDKRQAISSENGVIKILSASSDDSEKRDLIPNSSSRESSGTYITSPLQHRSSDANISPQKKLKLTNKRSLPLHLRTTQDEDDGEESDFGYLPGDDADVETEQTITQARRKPRPNGAIPALKNLKLIDMHTRTSIGSSISDDVFAESFANPDQAPTVTAQHIIDGAEQVPAESNWFEAV